MAENGEMARLAADSPEIRSVPDARPAGGGKIRSRKTLQRNRLDIKSNLTISWEIIKLAKFL